MAPRLGSPLPLPILLASLGALFACSDPEPAPSPACDTCPDGQVCRGGVCAPPVERGTCEASISQTVVTSARHVPDGEDVTWSSNPPAGGDHYAQWLRWARRHEKVARGNYVHNQEHGGVVLMNPCESGCDDISDALVAIGESLGKEALCPEGINARWVVVRDPLVPAGTGVAAAVWGWTFVAPCFDEAKIRGFIADHIGQGPEATCAEGSIP